MTTDHKVGGSSPPGRASLTSSVQPSLFIFDFVGRGGVLPLVLFLYKACV